MGAHAGRQALGDGPAPDLILNASLSPVQLIPDSSVFIQKELGYEGIPSFSIHATCLSFLVGLHVAGALVHAGAYRRILVVSSEQGSVSRDFDHPESGVLIGDGAAAAVVVPTPEGERSELMAFQMTTWPSGSHLAEFQGAGTRQHPNDPTTERKHNLFRMQGPSIYRKAVRKVARLVSDLLEQAELTGDDLDLVVPHQASGPALATLPRFGLPADRIVDIIGQYGNCIAASVPMALAHAEQQGRLKRGDKIMILGTGAGLSVAGAILRW
jgi:3-oxoacyl-[acyl-carrier-protein] synthase-3